ncbi:DUF4367 domain-containing protein [Paenibacillus sp. sptzw28]|uniref:DUF4367 domain-containing protein n=1 Tax=Paenibacillus sp. sptzw28 TaxID=715179 RepID=UPI001C6EFBF4|nr:DUF4367 domain-containing protein [Paenibacillus sp. sptzw28]QYR23766.1 DUF4367 domain-containing protein [Paenibacillus sp. sptzw28]
MRGEKYDFDHLIRNAIHDEIKDSPLPDLSTSDAWQQLNQSLYRSKKLGNKTDFPKKIMYAACLLFLFVALVTEIPQNGYAFGKITEIFHKIKGSTVQLFIKVGNPEIKDKDAPSNDFSIVQGSEVTSEQMSLEEAQKDTAFSIIVPEGISSEFVLKHVTVVKKQNEKKSKEIYLNYEGQDQRVFTVTEKEIDNQFGSGEIADQDDTKIEEINLNGQTATLFLFKDGKTRLIWTIPSHYFSIEGQITKEEIIQIAKSM